MNRKISYWKLRSSEIQTGVRTLIMGVLNVTPDSFSDGGRYSDPDAAYARALELEEQGADIIDIGGESTRPGSQRISADEEWRRLVQVLKKLKGQLRVPLSLDTWRSETAERALEYGIEIINDPSGLTFDPGIARVAANGNTGLVLNHMRGQPDTWAKLPPLPDPAGTIAKELEATVNRARHAGVERNRIVVDPGIGFGKRGDQNAVILAQLSKVVALDLPVLVGVSRKSFLAQQAEVDTEFATAAAVTAAILNGAHIVRVHDVKSMLSVVKIADEIARSAPEEIVPEKTEKRPRRGLGQMVEEPERHRPTRPPIAVVAPPPPPTPPEPVAPVVENAPAPKPEPRALKDRGGFAPPKRKTFEDRRPERREFKPRTFEPGKKFEQRGPKRPFEKREGPPGEKRPPREGRPPRGDRPAFDRKGPPRGDRPAFDRKGPPRGDRPAFDRKGPPRGDRPPFERKGPPRGEGRPPFERKGPPRGEGRPPSGRDRPPFDRKGPPKRPFRKRP